MSLSANNGTFYVALTCGASNDGGIDTVETNNGTTYIYLTANDYILFGQNVQEYAQPTTNTGTEYYLLSCYAPTTLSSLETNNGTGFLYLSAMNCVTFCD